MSHPNIFEVFRAYMQKQGADTEAQKAFAGLWNSTDSPNPNEATPIPCPQCFMDGVTSERGIKTTGVPEGYPPEGNGRQLEYFKCAFCKTRYSKLAE